MSTTRRLRLLAGTALVLAPLAGASADDAVTQQNEAWSNNDEVRSIVAEMLSDAETRSSLLQSGGTAGHDGDFFLASGDGNFRLNVGGQIQFRYLLNFRDDSVSSFDINDDGVTDGLDDEIIDRLDQDFDSGFQTRRQKLIFDGHVFDPALFFKVQGAFDRDGGDFELEDAYVGYEFDNGFTLRWGQFKLPVLREELVSSARQLAVERSVVNEVFNQGRSQGIELSYAQEMWRGAVAFSDGLRSANSDIDDERAFTDGLLPIGEGTESQWAFSARAEILFAGQWNQFRDFTSSPDDDFGLMLGIAGHIEGGDEDHNAFGGPNGSVSSFSGGEDYTYSTWTIDLSLESQGWNAFVAVVGAHSDMDDVLVDPTLATGTATTDISNDDFGLVLQGGVRIPNTDWEVFARYDVLFPDDDTRGDHDDFSVVTLGANYYLHGHAAKFSADLVWFLDSAADISGRNTGVGYYGSETDDEVTLRFQFQLLF